MIYQIYRDKSELKYTANNITTIQNTTNDMRLGELGAWHKIKEDMLLNKYTTVGIYQARRAFHKNLQILRDTDFTVTDDSIYASRYVFTNETLYQQFCKCHPKYVNEFNDCIPTDYEQYKNVNMLYAHNMFYCTDMQFLKLYDFLFNIYVKHNLASIDTTEKFFSFMSERLITMWILANNLHVNLCDTLAYDKNTNKLLYTINGIDK